MARQIKTKLGRPLKGNSHRVPITIHIDPEILKSIDDIVAEERGKGHTGYSRSELINYVTFGYMESLAKAKLNREGF
jgi:hypothetical protein